MIPRTQHLTAIRELLNQFPVVCLIGARQVGKTTLARQLIGGEARPVTFFDLEPTDEPVSDPNSLETARGCRGESEREEARASASGTVYGNFRTFRRSHTMNFRRYG